MKLPVFEKLRDQRPKKISYLPFAFLIPFVCMIGVMIIGKFTPFGTSSMLYSDQYHQYYPFFAAFRRALLSGDSLLYNWDVGLGMDYLGLISYYLASPLNLFSVLVPEEYVLQYFSLLTPVRLGLAGLFFAIFLKKVFGTDDMSIALFGTFYGLCAWALGYMWNVMWVDTFAMLPLVMLGMVSLLRDNKFVLYTITLFLSIFANYYIGFFTCIFVLLTFFCYEICRWAGFKKFFLDLGKMALFSLLAIGMSAILELPAFAALQTTHSSNNTFPEGFRLNIADEHTWKGLLDAMRQVAGNMNGGQEVNFKAAEGLPNVYCGVIANILAILFFTCKDVRIRDKICALLLLAFLNVSFIIRQLDYIWHGFHFTNMIPYRFSFLYSFVVLYMAYRAYSLRHSFQLWQVVFAGLLAMSLACCTNNVKDMVYWAYNGAFLLLYLVFLVFTLPCQPKKEQKKPSWRFTSQAFRIRTGAVLMFCVMGMEYVLMLVNFGVYFGGTPITAYPRGTTSTASIIRYMKEREADNLFYRAEVTHTQTLNDGALNDYHGISTFTSSANVKVTEFMRSLGYGAYNTYNRYCYEEASPISNLFLGLKYMIARDGRVEDNAYFDTIHNYNYVYLLENNAYLPLGFLADTALTEVDFANSGNKFVFQNQLLSAASGITADYWKLIEDGLSITGTGVTIDTQTPSGYCGYRTGTTAGGTVTYRYDIQTEGFMCVYLHLSRSNNFSIWLNGRELYSEGYSLPQMLSVSDVKPGDVVELHITTSAAETATMSINAAILDEGSFRSAYSKLNASTLELTDFSNTRLEGTIDCNRDGVLYTSIPQNGNWYAMVDGQKVETVLIGDAMMGIPMTQGSHTVTLYYDNAAFNYGAVVSLVSLVAFAALYLSIYRPHAKPSQPEPTEEPTEE